jgi:hypothetical protein
MITRDLFARIKRSYGLQASWAVWGHFGILPKDNMDDLSIFDDSNLELLLPKLHKNYVLVGLNISTERISKPMSNFHGKNGEVYKLRYACASTPLWGSYMTDIFKDFPEAKSAKVLQFLSTKDGGLLETANVARFATEIRMIGAENATFVAMGDIVYQILQRNFSNMRRILKIPHYGYRINKEQYRTLVHNALNSH